MASKILTLIGIFTAFLLFFSGNIDLKTYGKCTIKYGEDSKINKIETSEDGTVYYSLNETDIRIYPNSNIDISGDNVILNDGMLVMSKTKYPDMNIPIRMFFIPEWGSAQFFRIGLPNNMLGYSGNAKITYNLPEKKIDISTKLNFLFESYESGSLYYGFFVPFFPSWKIMNFKINLEILELDNPYCVMKTTYNVGARDWKKQTIIFQKSKSTQLKNTDQKKYISERNERNKIFEENNNHFFLLGGFGYPFESIYPITSEMGFIREWKLSNGKLYSTDVHLGIDMAKKKGTKIYASADGIVRYAKYGQYVGNTVIIDHGLSLFSEYCHMNKILVSPGTKVKKGDLIGLVGMTGAATGPHLHWETRIYNIPVDPRSFLNIEDIFKE